MNTTWNVRKKKKKEKKIGQWATQWLLSKRWACVTFVPSGICQDYCLHCHQMLFLASNLLAREVEISANGL